MTDQQWEKLKEGAPHFESARRNWVRSAPRWLTDQVVEVYETVTGKKMINKNSNCSVCVLRIYQAAGKLYFDELEKRQANFEELKKRQVKDEKDEKSNNAQSKSRKRKKDSGDTRSSKKRVVETEVN